MHTWVEAYLPVSAGIRQSTPGSPCQLMEATPRGRAPRQWDPGRREQPDRSSRAKPVSANPRSKPGLANQDPTTGRSGEKNTPVWPLFVLVPLLLVAAVPLSKRALLARGRPEDLYRDLTGRLRDVLPPDRSIVADSPALTPTERVLILAGATGVEEAPWHDSHGILGPLYSRAVKETTWPQRTGTPCRPTRTCHPGEGR